MGDEYRREIGKITATFLGVEDHGHLTATLTMDFGGTGVAVGEYPLDKHVSRGEPRQGTAAGMTFLLRLLSACGVRSWEELRGRTIFVLFNQDRRVVGVENLPTEPGGRFLFSDVFGPVEP